MGNSFPPRGLSFPPIKWERWISSLPALLLNDPVLPHGSSRTVMAALCCLYVPPFQDLLPRPAPAPTEKPKILELSQFLRSWRKIIRKNSSQRSIRNQGLKKTVLNPTEWQEMAEPSPKTGSPDPQLSALPRPPLLLWGKSCQGWDGSPPFVLPCVSASQGHTCIPEYSLNEENMPCGGNSPCVSTL